MRDFLRARRYPLSAVGGRLLLPGVGSATSGVSPVSTAAPTAMAAVFDRALAKLVAIARR
jgi:hypothetical protein